MDMFDKYVKLIRRTAGDYARTYGLPYEDVEAQAFLIYCETLEKYDVSKGVQFITYLYLCLKSLNDYCKAERKHYAREFVPDPERIRNELESVEYPENLKVTDFLAVASRMLSIEAYDVLKWLVSFEWNDENNVYSCKPTIARVMKKFHYSRQKSIMLWNEIKTFWNSDGYALYA